MKIKELMESISYSWLTTVQQAFINQGVNYIDPVITTVKNLHTGVVGRHTGIYIIFKEAPDGTVFYYLGIATKGNTIHARFQPHYAKLTVNLSAMYGPNLEPRPETRWMFPKNWRKGVKQHFLDNPDDIPDYWTGKQKRGVQPINHEWKPIWKQGVDIDNLSVAIWNLSSADAVQIDKIETSLIQTLKPIFNGAKTKVRTN
jgi:hypothetical protein